MRHNTASMARAIFLLLAGAAAGVVRGADSSAADDGGRYSDRWVWLMSNLLVDDQVDKVSGIVERAGKAGYNAVVLADYKFNLLGDMPDSYFRNVKRVVATAAKYRMEVIPCLFPIGRSDGLLKHDPNLAEGMPVENAPFLVRQGEATLDPASRVELKNGGFEETRGDKFLGFGFQDEPGKVSFADHEVIHDGKTSCRLQNIHGNGRVIQSLKVRPHAAYRLSCWVKSRDLKPPGVTLLANGNRPLTYHEKRLMPTQDWTLVDVAFNTLDNSEISIYGGQWGGDSGSLWLDDMACEELPLVNVLRRDGCPFKVTDASGKVEYEEGKDFEPVVDPLLGRVPYAGVYNFNHAGAPLRLTAASRIHDGDHLLVSWYHPVIVNSEEVACCLTEPKVYELLADQARRVDELLKPKTFFMQHDELRMANWCASCRKTGHTPGELLADNARRCVEILKRQSPTARVAVWSDMFDPNHNAVKNFYLVNGTLANSWTGLPAPVIIANWNEGKARDSLRFFAEQGHDQVIAGYYDAGLDSFARWNAAAREVFPKKSTRPGAIGFMYTTWESNYGDLEAYGRKMAEK